MATPGPPATLELPGKEYFRAEVLGEGGCGAVMTVYDEDGEEWAAKQFDEGDDGTLDYTTLREVALLAALRREAVSHPHVVELRDMCTIDGRLCSVMPRHPMTLGGAIEGNVLRKQAEKLRVARGLLRGVDFLHANGVMHRDLKTANVLLTAELEPKIIDFSLAKVFALQAAVAAKAAQDSAKKKGDRKAKKRAGQAADDGGAAEQNTAGCGTPAFMPPEVCSGEAYNEKADIWSLGCCLLALFFAKFHDELLQIERGKAAHAKIAETRAKLSVDKPLPALLSRLLEVDGDARPSAREGLLEICKIAGEAEEPPPEPAIQCFCSSSASAPAKPKKAGKAGKDSSWFGFSDEEKAIKKWFDMFTLRNPMTRVGAHAYLKRCQASPAEGAGAVSPLICVILAARLYEPELPEPLDDLEFVQEWADEMELDDDELWDFDLETYKEQELLILRIMEYCLYLPPPASPQ